SIIKERRTSRFPTRPLGGAVSVRFGRAPHTGDFDRGPQRTTALHREHGRVYRDLDETQTAGGRNSCWQLMVDDQEACQSFYFRVRLKQLQGRRSGGELKVEC